MVERVNKNLILMNLNMVYYENLKEIMKNWMPELKEVRSYCKVWAISPMLPPNHSPFWDDIQCVNINLQDEELKTARERAIAESDPEVPTICLIEQYRKLPEPLNRNDEIQEVIVPKKISKEASEYMEEID